MYWRAIHDCYVLYMCYNCHISIWIYIGTSLTSLSAICGIHLFCELKGFANTHCWSHNSHVCGGGGSCQFWSDDEGGDMYIFKKKKKKMLGVVSPLALLVLYCGWFVAVIMELICWFSLHILFCERNMPSLSVNVMVSVLSAIRGLIALTRDYDCL